MKLSIKSLATVIVSSFAYISAQECNVQSDEIQLVNVISGSFQPSLLNVIPPAEPIGSSVRIVAVEDEGSASSFWFNEKQRLTDGFSAQFDFRISGGNTDGFAFLVQNDKINNILGFLGSGLGFKNGLDHYIAVTFDVCSDRGALFNCLVETVSIEFKESGLSSTTLNTVTLSGISLKDNAEHTVKVDYLQDVNQIVVFIDDILSSSTPIVSTTLPKTAAELFGSRFGFFGFTASNFEISPANIDILSFALQQIDSDSRLATDFTPNKFVDVGKRIQFKYVAVDSCNQPLSASELLLRNITTDSIVATLSENIESVNADEIPAVATTTIVNQTDGSFTIFFDMPVNRISDWDLLITLNDLPAQDMPQLKVVRTREQESEGIKTQTIILLCVLIGVLVLATIYMVKRLDSYRKKLKQHKEDIEYGKTKEQIDIIDSTIQYKMNPLIAPLEEMQKKLDQNLEVLERLKRGQEDAMDSGYTVDQLVEENEKLRREMNELKKEEQLVEVKTGVAASQRKLNYQGEKKDFGQERS